MDARNIFRKVVLNGEEYIEFITGGKNNVPVLVDVELCIGIIGLQ